MFQPNVFQPNVFQMPLTAAVAAVAGGPVSSAAVSLDAAGTPITATVAAVAGGPVASSAVLLRLPVEAAITAVAGGPSASADVTLALPVTADVAAIAGGPVSAGYVALGTPVEAVIAAVAGGPTSSASVLAAYDRPFTAVRRVIGGWRIGNLLVAKCELKDANGQNVDTDAHLHVFEDGVEVRRLTRSSGQISYTAAATGVSAGYAANLVFSREVADVGLVWHFPSLEFLATRDALVIDGPPLTD